MRLAIAVWNNRISPVFDVSRQLRIYEKAGDAFTLRETRLLNADSRLERLNTLTALKIDVLICGAVTGCMARELESAGIHVLPFVTGGVEDVLAAFASGGLLEDPAFRMPGCGRGRGRQGRGRGGGRGRGMGRGRGRNAGNTFNPNENRMKGA